ncbi:MAG: TonB family protein [Gemmatimonadaceae bacterium]
MKRAAGWLSPKKALYEHRLFAGAVVVLCLGSTGSTLFAQSPAMLGGLVTDSAGNPITGATLSIPALSLQARTDEHGEFRFPSVSPGAVHMQVRRLGFTQIERDLAVQAGETAGKLHFTLAAVPTSLAPVLVTSDRAEFTGRLAGYYRRMQRRSSGYFIARDEIDQKSYRTLSQLLKGVPGINAFALRSGGSTVRIRQRDCRPLVWLDGVPMPAGEVDLDAFPVSTFHGIEVYSGSTSAPSDYTANAGLSSCGTILLWSRGPDTELPRRAQKSNVDLEKLVASLSVFTALEVDRPVGTVNAATLDVHYPPELLAAKVGGTVVAEFVVDEKGQAEPRTFSIVSTTDVRFSVAVQQAVVEAKFLPAMKDGQAVRQIVQQPFNFAPAGRAVVQAPKN